MLSDIRQFCLKSYATVLNRTLMSKIGHFCLKLDYSVRLLARSSSNLRLIFQGMESIATSRRRRRSKFLKKKVNNCYKSILNKKRTGKKEIQKNDEKRKTYQLQSGGSGTEIWRKHTKFLKLKGYDSDT